MFNFNDGTFNIILNNPFVYVELGLSLILLVILNVFVFRTIKRANARIYVVLLSLGIIVAALFSMPLLWAVLLSILIVSLVVYYNVNIGSVRPYLSNSLKSKNDLRFGSIFGKKRGHKYGPIFDKEELYDKIEATVRQLSKTSTGGLITFERETELTDYAKSGTILNAPVSPELLVTIFYPGTRLHDGAVIIRRDTIYAAACYFDPITTGLSGKYGSRHRAALGISKSTDSVTIVVSEETGRVSLAVAGELIHVAIDDFRRLFEEYMASEAKPN